MDWWRLLPIVLVVLWLGPLTMVAVFYTGRRDEAPWWVRWWVPK